MAAEEERRPDNSPVHAKPRPAHGPRPRCPTNEALATPIPVTPTRSLKHTQELALGVPRLLWRRPAGVTPSRAHVPHG
jgi:hypothetical protein